MLINRFKDFGKEVDAVLIDEKTAELDSFRESIRNLSMDELVALNEQMAGAEGRMTATATQTGFLNEKTLILKDTYDKLAEAQEKAKEGMVLIGEEASKLSLQREEEAFQIDFVKTKEQMSNEERLAIKQQFNQQMSEMFNSDFDMQRVMLGKQVTAFRQAGVLEADIARFTAEQKKQIRLAEIEFQASSISQLIGGLGQLNEASAGSAKVNARLAQVQAIIDTYAGANKAFAQGGVFGFATGAAIIASGLANVLTISRNIGDLEKFNTGGIVPGTGNTDSVPALLTPGEVILNQAQQENVAQGLGGGINIEINAPLVDETVIDTIIPAIQKAQKLNLA